MDEKTPSTDEAPVERKMSFGTRNHKVVVRFQPALNDEMIELTPWQAREWAKLLKRMAMLAEAIPNPPRNHDHKHPGN